MKSLIKVFIFFCIISLASAQNGVQAPPVLYKNVTVVNPIKKGVLSNQDVLIQDGIIKKIAKTGKMKNVHLSTQEVDASGKYMIPGLWDGHIHLFQTGGLYTRPDAIDLQHRLSYDSNQVLARNNINDYNKRYIACGITGIIDCGGPDWNFDVRREQAFKPNAPNLYVSGPLITPWRPEVYDRPDHPFTLVKDAGEAVEEVERQLQFDPDFIKVWYIVGRPNSAEENFEMIRAICDRSHQAGKPVWIHATELETAKWAVKAGADVLVHLPVDAKVDEEFLKLVKKNEVMLIPTMWVFESYSAVFSKQLSLLPVEHRYGNPFEIATFYDMHEIKESELNDKSKARIEGAASKATTSPILLYNMKAIADYGIEIATGTDAGNIGVLHGPSLFHEFQWMKKAGLTNEQILKAATINGAKLLNHYDKYGSIEEGKVADFVLLNSNPLDDINNTQDIDLVCKSGTCYVPEALVSPTTVELAQMQLNGYNERNIEAFLFPYSEDVEVYMFPSELLYKGKDIMRENYIEYFKKAGPALHCQLVDRLIYNKYVFDKELVTTGIKGREEFSGQAIYEMKNDKIIKVWFIK